MVQNTSIILPEPESVIAATLITYSASCFKFSTMNIESLMFLLKHFENILVNTFAFFC